MLYPVWVNFTITLNLKYVYQQLFEIRFVAFNSSRMVYTSQKKSGICVWRNRLVISHFKCEKMYLTCQNQVWFCYLFYIHKFRTSQLVIYFLFSYTKQIGLTAFLQYSLMISNCPYHPRYAMAPSIIIATSENTKETNP